VDTTRQFWFIIARIWSGRKIELVASVCTSPQPWLQKCGRRPLEEQKDAYWGCRYDVLSSLLRLKDARFSHVSSREPYSRIFSCTGQYLFSEPREK
jgi:hypothetical protein